MIAHHMLSRKALPFFPLISETVNTKAEEWVEQPQSQEGLRHGLCEKLVFISVTRGNSGTAL
jgi:hypothetical protein